jgi:hypothetical protein
MLYVHVQDECVTENDQLFREVRRLGTKWLKLGQERSHKAPRPLGQGGRTVGRHCGIKLNQAHPKDATVGTFTVFVLAVSGSGIFNLTPNLGPTSLSPRSTSPLDAAGSDQARRGHGGRIQASKVKC